MREHARSRNLSLGGGGGDDDLSPRHHDGLEKSITSGGGAGAGQEGSVSRPTSVRRAGVHPPFAPPSRDAARRADPAQSQQRTRCGVSPLSRAPCLVGAYPSYAPRRRERASVTLPILRGGSGARSREVIRFRALRALHRLLHAGA
jgi:hypothetical protein